MDDIFITGKYQWSDRSEAFKDFQYLTNLRYQLITQLSEKLNNIHKVSLTEKSWHLMIGYWLVQFLTVTFDRYNRVKKNIIVTKKWIFALTMKIGNILYQTLHLMLLIYLLMINGIGFFFVF